MNEQPDFQFPLLTIKEVNPLLQKGDTIFAYEVKAITENDVLVSFYENKGLSLRNFIGEKMECLLEITKGKCTYGESKIRGDSIGFKYQWEKRLFEYFPELMKIRNRLFDAKSNEEESLRDFFESNTAKTYSEWGLNGINIGIYQTKPLLSSSLGFFFLNEYQFEEVIERLKLDDEVYIKIDELFLRGIRPVNGVIKS